MSTSNYSFLQKATAWAVHTFTASGLLAAFLALIAIDQEDWRMCWVWLFVALIIDGVDGTFARMARVKEVLPHIEGKYIDYVIDFATYAIIPTFFFYKTQMTSPEWMPWALGIMLLSSALYYGKSNMTDGDEAYFVGFPVLWNLVVFLLFFITDWGPFYNFLAILFFGLLHFVPLKFAYPSRAKRFFWGHLGISLLGVATACYVLYVYPDVPEWSFWVYLLIMAWFLGMAILETKKSK